MSCFSRRTSFSALFHRHKLDAFVDAAIEWKLRVDVPKRLVEFERHRWDRRLNRHQKLELPDADDLLTPRERFLGRGRQFLSGRPYVEQRLSVHAGIIGRAD